MGINYKNIKYLVYKNEDWNFFKKFEKIFNYEILIILINLLSWAIKKSGKKLNSLTFVGS